MVTLNSIYKLLINPFSPTMFSNSGPFTDMKLIPASLATALARSVFPQPGGPHSNTPVGAVKPKRVNNSECWTGAWNKETLKMYHWITLKYMTLASHSLQKKKKEKKLVPFKLNATFWWKMQCFNFCTFYGKSHP